MKILYYFFLMAILIPWDLHSFPLTNGSLCMERDIISSGGGPGRNGSGFYMVNDIIGTGLGAESLMSGGTIVLAPGYIGDPLPIKDVDYIQSKIVFPENNAFISKVDRIQGTVSSPIQIDKVQILIQRVLDNHYFNGQSWANQETWLDCTGKNQWTYTFPKDKKVFEYGLQYKIICKSTDVIGANEKKYPFNIFTYIYSTDFKKSVCNYPNPFYPNSSDTTKSSTTLEYFLSDYKKINIYIYSINGELVKSWSGEELNTPGLHRLKWDGRNEKNIFVGSGIFMFVVDAGTIKAIEKIAVIR